MTDLLPVMDHTAAYEVDIAHEPDEAFTWFGRPLNGANKTRDRPEFHEPVEAYEPYFFDIAMDAVVSVPPTCSGSGNPSRFLRLCFGDWPIERPGRNDCYRRLHEA